MSFIIKDNMDCVDWNQVRELLKKEDMAAYDGDRHKKAFENSSKVAFLYAQNVDFRLTGDETLIGL